MSLRLSRGEAEGESEMRELCRAPIPRTHYSLSNLYHPGMRGFERVATRGNKKCGLCLYLIHTFGPIACVKSDGMWYKYIYCITIFLHYSYINLWDDHSCASTGAGHFYVGGGVRQKRKITMCCGFTK